MGRTKVVGLLAISFGLVLVATGAWALGWSPVQARPDDSVANTSSPTLEWFGWSHFRITSAHGTIIHTNPFITGNPDASIALADIVEADLILVANGHGDELGDTIALANQTGATVLTGGFELGSWVIQQGVPASQVQRSNPGNWHHFGGITIRVVNSVHGSGLPEPTIENPYGGPAAGFIITLENGYTIYFAGSTAATMDMQLWGAAYKPDLAILPLNSDRDPSDIAQMVRLLSTDNEKLTKVIPHHNRVVPPAGAATVAQMEEAIRLVNSSVTVIKLQQNLPEVLTK